MRRCRVDGCERSAEPFRALCAGHRKRQKRGKPVDEPLREYGLPPLEQLTKASLRHAEAPAEDDEEYRRAVDLLRKHALAYSRSLMPLKRWK